MAEIERRSVGGEIRAEGRRLSGTVMRWNEISPSHRERFLAGSLRSDGAVPINLFHDPERAFAWSPGGGMVLSADDDALSLVVDDLPPLPAGDRALAEIRSGSASSLSIEFVAERETRVDGIRVVEAAVLTGIGLVQTPSYAGSQIEARGAAMAMELKTSLMAVDLSSAALNANMSEADFKDALVAFAQSFPDRAPRPVPIWAQS